MKHIFLIISLLGLPFLKATAQQTAGEVQYKKTVFWSKIYRDMPFLSAEERDRELLAWGNDEGYSTNMKLLFDANQSLYTYGENNNEEGTFAWRKADFLIYRNFAEQKVVEIEELIGKTHAVRDSLPAIKWRVMNDLKEIQGQLCMRALTYNPVKKYEVEAWFAANIPVSAGPERYFGLPGLILELSLDKGKVIIEAEKIAFKDISSQLVLPKKIKGKELTISSYNKLLTEHIESSIKGQRNPYWGIEF